MPTTKAPVFNKTPHSEREALRQSLAALHGRHLLPLGIWSDSADHAFITRHLIERSLALNINSFSGRLIDVGCGPMPYRGYYQNATSVLGCDLDDSRGPVDFVCPAHRIPSERNSFDTIVCTEVLEHVPDPAAVWREFFRILAPGGKVLLATPSYWPAHEIPHDYYRYTEHGLRYLAQTAGFVVERVIPRGGVWAFYGQVGVHVLSHYMKIPGTRLMWNSFFLWADRARLNPSITLGWTIVALKPKT